MWVCENIFKYLIYWIQLEFASGNQLAAWALKHSSKKNPIIGQNGLVISFKERRYLVECGGEDVELEKNAKKNIKKCYPYLKPRHIK